MKYIGVLLVVLAFLLVSCSGEEPVVEVEAYIPQQVEVITIPVTEPPPPPTAPPPPPEVRQLSAGDRLTYLQMGSFVEPIFGVMMNLTVIPGTPRVTLSITNNSPGTVPFDALIVFADFFRDARAVVLIPQEAFPFPSQTTELMITLTFPIVDLWRYSVITPDSSIYNGYMAYATRLAYFNLPEDLPVFATPELEVDTSILIGLALHFEKDPAIFTSLRQSQLTNLSFAQIAHMLDVSLPEMLLAMGTTEDEMALFAEVVNMTYSELMSLPFTEVMQRIESLMGEIFGGM
jgi:hypothetical protein